MDHYAGLWNIDKNQREPCDFMFGAYMKFWVPREVYPMLRLTDTDLVERFLTVNGWIGDPLDSYKEVTDFGVCAVMHCVGPRGGYCVICDEMGISNSRLMAVEMEGDELADYTFGYLGLGEADGVNITRMIRHNTDTTVGAGCPTLYVSQFELWELYTDVMGGRLPNKENELIRIFVDKGILCKIETVNGNTATEGDSH
jgi:hypothetical protein